MNRYLKGLFLIIAAAFLIGCHIDPSVHVGGGNPPRFWFSSNTVTSELTVYRVPPEYRHKPLPGELFKDSNPDMQWVIRGEREGNEGITYGVVPAGMQEVVKAKPLVEGEIYFVTVSGAGQYFFVYQGLAQEAR